MKDLRANPEDDVDEMDLKWQLAMHKYESKKDFIRELVKRLSSMEVILLVMTRKRWNVSIVICWDILLKSAEILGVKRTGAEVKTAQGEQHKRDRLLPNFALYGFLMYSDGTNNKTCSKTCLKNFEDLKSKYDKLRIELNKSESDLDSYKKGLALVEEQLLKNVSKEVKKTSDAPIIDDWVSDCDEDETVVLESLNVQKPKQADQPRKFAKNYKSNDPSLSRSYTLGRGEDSLKLIELMDLCTKLIEKVTILENTLKQSKETHAQTLTMLMKKVKRLEDKLKFLQHKEKGKDGSFYTDKKTRVFDFQRIPVNRRKGDGENKKMHE
ncbi:hypothetical protein Tco_0293905 [Tanacetum coccineum]